MSGKIRDSVCVVGGTELAVGGWAQYEVEREQARSERKLAPTRKRIYLDDVLLTYGGSGKSANAVLRASERLATALTRLQKINEYSLSGLSKHNIFLVLPAVTAEQIRHIGHDAKKRADLYEIRRLAADAQSIITDLNPMDLNPLVKTYGGSKPHTRLRLESADRKDRAAIIRLEQQAIPELEALERAHAETVLVLETATNTINSLYPE